MNISYQTPITSHATSLLTQTLLIQNATNPERFGVGLPVGLAGIPEGAAQKQVRKTRQCFKYIFTTD
jgi:hypothetical protein